MHRFAAAVCRSLFALNLAGMLSLCAFAGTVIHVPADQPTIQDAINVSKNGDTVLVAPGTYYENIDFSGKNITVTSSGGPEVTVIDGSHFNGGNYAVTFQKGEKRTAVLSGFTVQGGYTSVYITSSPTIKGNLISGYNSNNEAVFIQGGASLIEGNLVNGFGNGQSGIFVIQDSGVQIIGNVISGGAAGITLQDYGVDLIKQNTLINSFEGISISYVNGTASPASFVQNLIAAQYGVYWSLYNDATTVPVSFVNNTISGDLGAVSIYPADGASFQNNLLIAPSNQAAMSCGFLGGTWAAFTNNDVFSYSGSAYSCTDETGTNGNVSVDPQFVNLLDNDLHLMGGSPVIGAGTTSVVGLPNADFDGDPRIINSKIDIGADEYRTNTVLRVSTYVLRYADQLSGTTSAPQTVTLTNKSIRTIPVTMVATGRNFTETNNCGTGLAAGASCQINVTFAPLSGGTLDSVLGIFTGATLNPEAITLAGTAVAPQVQLTPNYVQFTQAIGTTGMQTVSLMNTGTVPLLISSVTYSGASDFGETNNCPIAPKGLAGGASCTFTVTYAPMVPGYDNGQFTVNNNSGSPIILYVGGTAVSDGIATLKPAALVFPATLVGQMSAPKTVTLTNTGKGPLGIGAVYDANDFLETDNCPLVPNTLAPGAGAGGGLPRSV